MVMTLDPLELFAPPVHDITWSLAAVAVVGLFVVGLVQWARASFGTVGEQTLWLVLILFVPVLGPTSFILRRRTQVHDRIVMTGG